MLTDTVGKYILHQSKVVALGFMTIHGDLLNQDAARWELSHSVAMGSYSLECSEQEMISCSYMIIYIYNRSSICILWWWWWCWWWWWWWWWCWWWCCWWWWWFMMFNFVCHLHNWYDVAWRTEHGQKMTSTHRNVSNNHWKNSTRCCKYHNKQLNVDAIFGQNQGATRYGPGWAI